MAPLRATLSFLAAPAIIVDATRHNGNTVAEATGNKDSGNWKFASLSGMASDMAKVFTEAMDAPTRSLITREPVEQIEKTYDQHDGSYRVWSLGCFNLVVWNRNPQSDFAFLDCDLCEPGETTCVYNMYGFRALMYALGYPLQTVSDVVDKCPRFGSTGFTQFCSVFCVPDASRTACKLQELPKQLVSEALTSVSVGMNADGVPGSSPACVAEPFAAPEVIEPGTIVMTPSHPETLWIAQRHLPEGWVVRKPGTEVELVISEQTLKIASTDNDEVNALHKQQVEALEKCRRRCAELDGEGKEAEHDGCCWKVAAKAGMDYGSCVSAACVAICTGRDTTPRARKQPKHAQMGTCALKDKLPSWVKIDK